MQSNVTTNLDFGETFSSGTSLAPQLVQKVGLPVISLPQLGQNIIPPPNSNLYPTVTLKWGFSGIQELLLHFLLEGYSTTTAL